MAINPHEWSLKSIFGHSWLLVDIRVLLVVANKGKTRKTIVLYVVVGWPIFFCLFYLSCLQISD
jgi:hypothetical protein